MSATTTLATFVDSTTIDDVPPDVRDLARRCLRDHVGVALLGSESDAGEQMREYATTAFPGTAATVIGGGTATPQGAALANGTFAHVDDYDDTFDSIVIHPSTPVAPAALAAAEDEDGTGAELLTALVVGSEVLYRVGHAVYPEHYDNGWHLTATVGTFGAAAAAASIYGLETDAIERAFGIAGSNAPTSLKRNMGSEIKLTHPGQGAQRGLEAAIMARAGWTANQQVLDGEKGYPDVMAPGRADTSVDTDGLGDTWALPDVGFKLYPSAIVTHAGIYALEYLLANEEIDPDEIESIDIEVDESIDVLKHPTLAGPFEAKFSFEFCLGLIVARGSVEPSAFSDPTLADESVQRAMDLVSVVPVSGLFGSEYFGYGARVRVETANGAVYTREQPTPPAMPYEPSDDAALEEKFYACAETVLDEERVTALNDELMTLGDAGTLDPVFELLG